MKSRSSASRGSSFKRKPAAAGNLFTPIDESDIEIETVLLPDLIAERVLGEAERCLGQRFPDAWSVQLAQRAFTCYRRNPRFRLWLNRSGNESRDWLSAFMRHWLTGLLRNYDETLCARLPVGYSIGCPAS